MRKFCKDCIHYKICEYSTIIDKPTTCKDFFTADVAPVIHGEWKVINTFNNGAAKELQCSVCECKAIFGKVTIKFCPNCGARMDGGNKSSPVWIQGSAEEAGSALKELYDNLSRCNKCVNEYRCSKTMDKEGKCPIYKRDPKDGGFYG
jgi:hypothetical protein